MHHENESFRLEKKRKHFHCIIVNRIVEHTRAWCGVFMLVGACTTAQQSVYNVSILISISLPSPCFSHPSPPLFLTNVIISFVSIVSSCLLFSSHLHHNSWHFKSNQKRAVLNDKMSKVENALHFESMNLFLQRKISRVYVNFIHQIEFSNYFALTSPPGISRLPFNESHHFSTGETTIKLYNIESLLSLTL